MMILKTTIILLILSIFTGCLDENNHDISDERKRVLAEKLTQNDRIYLAKQTLQGAYNLKNMLQNDKLILEFIKNHYTINDIYSNNDILQNTEKIFNDFNQSDIFKNYKYEALEYIINTKTLTPTIIFNAYKLEILALLFIIIIPILLISKNFYLKLFHLKGLKNEYNNSIKELEARENEVVKKEKSLSKFNDLKQAIIKNQKIIDEQHQSYNNTLDKLNTIKSEYKNLNLLIEEEVENAKLQLINQMTIEYQDFQNKNTIREKELDKAWEKYNYKQSKLDIAKSIFGKEASRLNKLINLFDENQTTELFEKIKKKLNVFIKVYEEQQSLFGK